MPAEELNDHLPAPAERKPKGAKAEASGSGGGAPRGVRLADRILFALGGAVVGFTLAYVYLEKFPNPVPPAGMTDPHAGLTGVGAGATRDLPGSGGGAPSVSADPAAKQKLAELEEAVTRSPKDYSLLVQLGNAAYDADDSRRAIDAYERALAVKDGDPNVLTDLGVSYRNLGDVDKALSAFDRALKADPGHWQAVFNQAIVYGVDKGDAKRATALLDKLKKEHPEIPALDRLEATIKERAKNRA